MPRCVAARQCACGGGPGQALTARLLAFSRSEELPTISVDVRSLVLGMTEWIKQTVAARSCSRCARRGGVRGETDSNQLELAILNLVLNARDALPVGGSVTIDVARVD